MLETLHAAAWYQDFVRFVQLKGKRPRTETVYLGWVRQLALHYRRTDLNRIGHRKVLDFFIHLKDERQLKASTINQAICALRMLYRDHLGRTWSIWNEVSLKREEPLPHVLTRQEVDLLLRTFRDGRYRAYFTTVYHCGLRLGEALAIQPQHINAERLTLRVVEGKGGKQREVPLSPELLQRLRTFYRYHRNPKWLFPGVGRGWKGSGKSLQEAMHEAGHAMTRASAWAAINVAKAECGLSKTHEKLTTHTLRHSYATHMLEAGTSVRQVAAYLGHSSLKPVMVYLHLTEISEEQARNALTTLPMG
ncbi:MAG: site-specific integrase [Verrucomicrobiota bacterium]